MFKVNENCLKVESLAFEMMITNLEYQIKWHEALIEELDQCLEASAQIAEIIRKYDFSTMNDITDIYHAGSLENIEMLKREILSGTTNSEKKLDELIHLLNKNKN